MKAFPLCTVLLFALFAAHSSALAQAPAPQPNVVIFLADDQGWGDLSISGNGNLATPRIDSLARDGITFENFYVCQLCAPTRAEFLTGRYYPRTGVSGVSEGQERLEPGETTVAEIFQENGYATGAFGKWHNGTQSPYHPNDQGFDEYYGFTSGHWGHYFSPPLDHNGETVRGEGYLPDDLTNHAIAFLEENRDRPFFCYLPFNTPHSPMMVDDDFYGKFADLDPAYRHRDPEREDLDSTRAALAMCENIDWNVGRVLDKLDELGLAENTIVIYFSDNGPNTCRWNGGMKGKKGAIDEGGLRSPFFLRWPGRVPAGTVRHEVAGAIDLLPTLAKLTGLPADTTKPLDGRSLAPLLGVGDRETKGNGPGKENGESWSDRRLFSIRRKQVSVRAGKFRLDAKGRLFDVATDRGQHHDVAEEHPELVAELTGAAERYRTEMLDAAALFVDRPFTVGHAQRTVLPARDGIPHGPVQRSAKWPNNSFFENWTSADGAITWDIATPDAGIYEAIVHYTCAEGDTGAILRLAAGNGDSTEATVTEVFDPPLYDKSKERVEESHYFVKDFRPLSLGRIRLEKGRVLLRLSAPKIPGDEAVDVHSVVLIRTEE